MVEIITTRLLLPYQFILPETGFRVNGGGLPAPRVAVPLSIGFHGTLTLANVDQVFAWDTDNNAVDEDEDDGRSFISVLSEVITDDDEDCDGRAKNEMGEGRMDIEDSEMAYLGFYDGESYGLVWKVGRG